MTLRTLIVGAGRTARALARDLRETAEHGLRPVAVLDDATASDLARLIPRHEARAVVLADPGLPAPRFRELADAAVAAGAVVRYLPWFAAALPREATGSDLRPLDITALIDGPDLHVASPDVKEIVTGKRVLVTGAGSTLGSELCRQLHAFDPDALWSDELSTDDIQDRDQTSKTFRRLKPEVVFHAAGLRQASVLERRPSQAVKANILTTDNLARAAARHATERFILIAADADPMSMLGASHRVAEAAALSATHTTETVFAAVRIGDVLDPRNSLLTALADQIRSGGPVTITHPNASRCFATAEEAVALTLEAGRMAAGGEVYSLDLGEPVRITEVVARFTRQYKLPEVPIRYVGRGLERSKNPAPAERIPTAHPQIFTMPADADPAEYAHLPERLDKLYKAAAKNRDPKVRQMLAKPAAIRRPLPPPASGA